MRWAESQRLPPAQVCAWAERWGWQARRADHDEEIGRLTAEARRRHSTAALEVRIEVQRAILASCKTARRVAEHHAKAAKGAAGAVDLSPGEAMRLASTALAASGVLAQVDGAAPVTTPETLDLGRLTLDELEALASLQAKARGPG